MTSIQSTAPALPWYRQFWPWFIFSLPAAVVVAGVITVIIANRHADDLVVRDYYKTGLAINQQLEKREHAAQLGMSIQLQLADNRVVVRLNGPHTPQSLLLRLSHPLESDKDVDLLLTRQSVGHYSAELLQPVSPRWHWVLEAPVDSQWRLDGVLGAENFPDTGKS